MKCKLAIIILNYINYEDTLECLKCALNQRGEGYEIIVVENGSKNESYQILKDVVEKHSNVTLLKLEENIGFAQGNNYGIAYAREKFRAEYIFVCNSDVTFSDALFESVLALSVKGIGVVSPPVINSDKCPQTVTISTNNIYYKIAITIIQILLYRLSYLPIIHKFYLIIHDLKKLISIKYNKKTPRVTKFNNPKDKKYNIQGCSYFLMPEFFKYYEQLYPLTFLYWEEINLIVYLSKVKLQAVIKDLPVITHKGKKSIIHLISSNDYEKKRLKYSTKSMIKSLPMFFRSYVSILAKYN